MKKATTLLVSAILAGGIFWLALYSMDFIQHVPHAMKRSLSFYVPVCTAVVVLLGVWLRRKGSYTDIE